MKFLKTILLTMFLSVLLCSAAQCDNGNITMRDVMIMAVSTHPEVEAKWHALRGGAYEKEAAHGGYRPKLDISAGIGRDSLDGIGYSGSELKDYNRDGFAVFLTQMIYDGRLTRSSVLRYTHAERMRYFDLIATIEQTALATAHVYADLFRYQRLVNLAKDNLSRHEEIFLKVEERTKAGVDSSVNLDTAKGRLALARSNLITCESNLHDTVTQFVRIVGRFPMDNLVDTEIYANMPSSADRGVDEAMRSNPLVLSYAENAKAMDYAIDQQKSKLRPHVELRAGTAQDMDHNGTEGWRRRAYVELGVRYNIYNGWIDNANMHKASEQHKESLEIFKKTQRDITQSVLVSFNDVKAYDKQLPNLAEHRNSSDATRKAYVKQFEAGRRSLLDLLDSENEFYQSELGYVNALYNQRTAKADYLAATGNLLSCFSIVKDNVPTPKSLGIVEGEIATTDTPKRRK